MNGNRSNNSPSISAADSTSWTRSRTRTSSVPGSISSMSHSKGPCCTPVMRVFHTTAAGECRTRHGLKVRRHNQRIRHSKRFRYEIGARALFWCGHDAANCKGFNVGIDGFYKSSHSVLDEGQFGEALIFRRSITSVARFTEANLRQTMTGWVHRVSECGLRMGAWNERQLVTILIWSRWVRVHQEELGLPRPRSALQRLGRHFLHVGRTGRRESMDSMATGCAKVLPILKSSVPTRHSTFTCHAGSRSRRRLPLKSVSMRWTCSTKSMNCAPAAASVSVRHSLVSGADFTAPWPTNFELARYRHLWSDVLYMLLFSSCRPTPTRCARFDISSDFAYAESFEHWENYVHGS
jgi:hypothetical protein